MGTKETEYAPGVVSSMRVTLKTARESGVFMIISGVAMAAAMLVLDRGYELIPFITVMEGAGPAMITGLSYAKAVQAGAEKNEAGQ